MDFDDSIALYYYKQEGSRCLQRRSSFFRTSRSSHQLGDDTSTSTSIHTSNQTATNDLSIAMITNSDIGNESAPYAESISFTAGDHDTKKTPVMTMTKEEEESAFVPSYSLIQQEEAQNHASPSLKRNNHYDDVNTAPIESATIPERNEMTDFFQARMHGDMEFSSSYNKKATDHQVAKNQDQEMRHQERKRKQQQEVEDQPLSKKRGSRNELDNSDSLFLLTQELSKKSSLSDSDQLLLKQPDSHDEVMNYLKLSERESLPTAAEVCKYTHATICDKTVKNTGGEKARNINGFQNNLNTLDPQEEPSVLDADIVVTRAINQSDDEGMLATKTSAAVGTPQPPTTRNNTAKESVAAILNAQQYQKEAHILAAENQNLTTVTIENGTGAPSSSSLVSFHYWGSGVPPHRQPQAYQITASNANSRASSSAPFVEDPSPTSLSIDSRGEVRGGMSHQNDQHPISTEHQEHQPPAGMIPGSNNTHKNQPSAPTSIERGSSVANPQDKHSRGGGYYQQAPSNLLLSQQKYENDKLSSSSYHEGTNGGGYHAPPTCRSNKSPMDQQDYHNHGAHASALPLYSSYFPDLVGVTGRSSHTKNATAAVLNGEQQFNNRFPGLRHKHNGSSLSEYHPSSPPPHLYYSREEAPSFHHHVPHPAVRENRPSHFHDQQHNTDYENSSSKLVDYQTSHPQVHHLSPTSYHQGSSSSSKFSRPHDSSSLHYHCHEAKNNHDTSGTRDYRSVSIGSYRDSIPVPPQDYHNDNSSSFRGHIGNNHKESHYVPTHHHSNNLNKNSSGMYTSAAQTNTNDPGYPKQQDRYYDESREDTGVPSENEQMPSLTSSHPTLRRNYSYPSSSPPGQLLPYYNRHILPLSTGDDENWLSEFLCFVRSQCVEVFKASPEDVAARMNSKKVLKGQVGIRCRFCAHLPHRERTGRSSSFPSSINRIYQSLTMMLRDHFTKCNAMPPGLKERYLCLKANASQGATDSKRYWIDSAHILGLIDTGDAGIRFVYPSTHSPSTNHT